MELQSEENCCERVAKGWQSVQYRIVGPCAGERPDSRGVEANSPEYRNVRGIEVSNSANEKQLIVDIRIIADSTC